MAVAAHRARLPLSFFHQIPSPPCHQPSRPALPTTTAETAGATSNNNASEWPDLNPPLLSGEGGPRDGGGAGGGDNWPPPPGTPAAGLYQGDNIHSDGRPPAEKAGGLAQAKAAAGGKGTDRKAMDEGSGARADFGTVCVWRRCRVKGRAAAEERHASDVAVVVEWDDEAGGQVRREDSGSFCFRDIWLQSASPGRAKELPAALAAAAIESTSLACHICTI